MISKNLIESIVENDLISASDIFKSRMEEILECKLYEEKRRIAAELNEVMGGKLSARDIQARRDAGYMKASHYFEIMDRLKDMQTKAEKEKAAKEGGAKPSRSRKKNLEEVTEKEKAEIAKAGEGAPMRIAKQFGATAGAMKDVETTVAPSQGTVDQAKETRPRKVDPSQKSQKTTDTIKRPDWASLSQKTIQNVKDKRRQEKIQKWKETGKTDKAKKLQSAITTRRFLKTLGTGLRAVKRGAEEIGRTGGSI